MALIPKDFSSKKILTPGPVPLPEYVKQSLHDYECHHRMKPFADILLQVFADLKKIFQTEQHCYVLASTGTGGLEASVVNVLRTSDHMLFIEAGKFGERWGQIAKAYGVKATAFPVPWGEDVDLKALEEQMATGHYTALAFQACETSTGALLPTEQLCQLAQKYQMLSLVDGITALGAVDLPMDKWGIDVLIGGSQKAFMLPTGLAFISLSQRAEARESNLPRFYFDLKKEKQENLKGRTQWSTPTHPVLALHLVLEQILKGQGLPAFLKDIHDRAQYFRQEVGLPLFPKTASPSVSCLRVPPGMSAKAVVAKVYEAGYMIVAGQDQLEDQVLRVGHMGEMTESDLKGVAVAIRKAIGLV